MNDCSIGSQRHIGIWIGGLTSTKLLVSSVDNIFVQHDTPIMFPFSTDTIIHIRNKQMAGVSVLHNIILSGSAKYHLPCC